VHKLTFILNTCSLFGASNYVNSWLGINYLVIAASFAVVALVYMAGSLLPGSTRTKITSMTKVEMTQLLLSVLIIIILMGVSQVACSFTTAISQATVKTTLSPFQYADFYIGNLSTNTGLRLLGNIYSISITYAIDSRIWTAVGSAIQSLSKSGEAIISFPYGYDLGTYYGILSDLYLDVFSPIIIVTIGMLFLQYLLLPIIEYTAFVIVLPIALVMRSISFTGSGLRTAANSVLALAIAAYLIYPMMVAFDGYAIAWIFSPSNPEYSCNGCLSTVESTYSLTSIPSSAFDSLSSSSSGFNVDGLSSPAISSILSSSLLGDITGNIPVYGVIANAASTVSLMSQFIFTAIFMFGINLAVTLGFAIGLAKGLNSGVEGAGSFWSSI